MSYLIILIIVVAILFLLQKSDSTCDRCGKEYEKGFDKQGSPIHKNKHLSREYIPDISGVGPGWNTECYCTECYKELFGEEPQD